MPSVTHGAVADVISNAEKWNLKKERWCTVRGSRNGSKRGGKVSMKITWWHFTWGGVGGGRGSVVETANCTEGRKG